MKSSPVVACLLSVGLAFASTVGAPTAAADDINCQWMTRDLPLPSGATTSQTAGRSTNDLLVGSVSLNRSRGVVWQQGRVQPMAEPSSSATSVVPKGINSGGVVVGYQETNNGYQAAFRYQNGAYQQLPTEAGEQSIAVGINDAGDIVGHVYPTSAPGGSAGRAVAGEPAPQDPRFGRRHRHQR